MYQVHAVLDMGLPRAICVVVASRAAGPSEAITVLVAINTSHYPRRPANDSSPPLKTTLLVFLYNVILLVSICPSRLISYAPESPHLVSWDRRLRTLLPGEFQTSLSMR